MHSPVGNPALPARQVVSIMLNESYQLTRSYHTELLAMFQRGLVSQLLSVDSADSFELVSEKEIGSLIMLRYRRVREGVTLLPDKLIVFIEPSGAGYSLRSIVSSLGDVGGATCGRVSKRWLNRHDPSRDPSMTVIWSRQFLFRHEGTYRCVYLWQSEKQIPVSGDMKANHIRIVDMRTGEVLLDADGIKHDGGNDDVHHFDTYLSVPYKTPSLVEPNAWYDIPTRLPVLRVWAMGPARDPVLHKDYYNPPLEGFVPSVVIDNLGATDDHTDYRYLQVFEHMPAGGGVQPTIHNFLSWTVLGLYRDYVGYMVSHEYDRFLPDSTDNDPADFVIPYHLFDHNTGNMYNNARVFAGMYNQYMNIVGSYHTDPVIGWAYFESADHHHPARFCELQAWDYGGENLGDYALDAAELYVLMMNKDYARRMVAVNPPGTTYFGPNFVKANTIEITRAAKQHDWLQLMGMEYPTRVSASPSHAHAITASGNQATVLNVKYTPIAREKWVNFFASANAKYNLYTIGGTGQEIELYRVLEGTTGGALKLLGTNDECTSLTDVNSVTDNTIVVDVEQAHDTCPVIAGIAQPSITFTPKKSGWFYALIKGTVVGEALLALEPAGTHITSTSRSATPAFDTTREWRLGQSIPVSIPGPPAMARRGVFMEPTELHHWKFQHYPPTRLNGYSDRGDPSRQFGPFRSSGQGAGRLNMNYIVRVVRPDDGTVLQLQMAFTRYDGGFVPPGILIPFVTSATVPGPLPGQVTDEWTVPARALNGAARHRGGNVLLRLRRSPTAPIRQQWEYDIYVFNENSNQPDWMEVNDTTSFQGGSAGAVGYSGIYTVPRWCNGENIELTLDNFQITERLSPDDADYFHIWLEEGEHLNITYRGQIPAAIDVDGPDKQPASGMSESMLNDFIIRELVDGGTDRADHYTVGFGDTNWVNDYRPVLPDQSQLECGDAACMDFGITTNCCAGIEYFAQRGYLWSFNKCSASDDTLAPSLGALECTHLPHELYSTSNITADNALHLTLTAFISGRYTIRVRSQNEGDVKLDGYWRWSFPRFRVGAPYTLDFNLGVFPNKLRPHWQWLQNRADPAPHLPCSRSGVCGDGVAHPREECDDGNTVGGDGCDADCFIED